MYYSIVDILIVVLLLAFAAAMYLLYRRNLELAVSSRMQRMMVSCGLNAERVASGQLPIDIDMEAAFERCQFCAVPELCERWLDGDAVASNGFCVNARAFTKAATSS